MIDLYVKIGEDYQRVGALDLDKIGETPIVKGGYSVAFECFWKAYPQVRRIGKGAAWKAWQKIKGGHDVNDAIVAALTAQKLSPQWTKDGGQFIPLPATWLNQRRWEDDAHKPPEAKPVATPGACPGWLQERCGVRLTGGGRCSVHAYMAQEAIEAQNLEERLSDPDEDRDEPGDEQFQQEFA